MAGYAWLYVHLYGLFSTSSGVEGVCLFRHITGIPCPSCGATRSVIAIIEGHLWSGIYINPLGIIILFIMIITPIWIIYDGITRQYSLFNFYQKMEVMLRKKYIAVPFVLLLLLNWYWNLYKYLG
jgi:hypothetical protein